MPQRTWLDPYVVFGHINNLQASVLTFKFVDDVSLMENVEQSGISHMQLAVKDVSYCSQLPTSWSDQSE